MTTPTLVRNFRCLNIKSQSIISNGVSVRIPVPLEVDDVMIINEGPKTAFIRSGDSNVEADILAMPILNGEKGIYGVGETSPPVTHIAVFVDNPAQAITLLFGQGA